MLQIIFIVLFTWLFYESPGRKNTALIWAINKFRFLKKQLICGILQLSKNLKIFLFTLKLISKFNTNDIFNLKRSYFSIILLGVVVVSSPGVALSENLIYIICKSQKNVRTLRVEGGGTIGNGCRAVYTKSGIDSTIGSSRNRKSCDQYVNHVQKNLEMGNWKCRNVPSSRVSELNESQLKGFPETQ